MKPIPVEFHVGPLVLHTYGIGLAITFLISYYYFRKRLRDHGFRSEWLANVFVWVVLAAVVGARIVHVLANLGLYSAHPALIPQIWKGGLSSYGGLIGGFLVGVPLFKRRCPELNLVVALDLVAPVLMLGWAIGRLLGPQLMVAGGGPPTHAFYGMYYAGQVGKRVPVPIFQAIESFIVYRIALWVERKTDRGPAGMTFLSVVVFWDIARFFDQYLWLDYPNHVWDPVEVGALCLIAAGILLGYITWRRWMAAGRPVPQRWPKRVTEQQPSVSESTKEAALPS